MSSRLFLNWAFIGMSFPFCVISHLFFLVGKRLEPFLTIKLSVPAKSKSSGPKKSAHPYPKQARKSKNAKSNVMLELGKIVLSRHLPCKAH
jgi:hypothetical protein